MPTRSGSARWSLSYSRIRMTATCSRGAVREGAKEVEEMPSISPRSQTMVIYPALVVTSWKAEGRSWARPAMVP